MIRIFYNKLKYLVIDIARKITTQRIVEANNGLRYYVNKFSSLDYTIIKHGQLDEYIIKENFLNTKDPVIFDIGANAGYISLPLSLVNNSRILSYEPDPENFERLKKNILLNKITNISAFEIALQEKSNSSVDFYIRDLLDGDYKINQGISTLSNINLGSKKKIRVQASTIDSEVKKLDIKKVDFIKIDVEGNEYKVLMGGLDTLKKFNPIVQYEFSKTIDQLQGFNNSEKAFNLLKNLGYLQYNLVDEKNLVEIREPEKIIDNSNILCFKKKENES